MIPVHHFAQPQDELLCVVATTRIQFRREGLGWFEVVKRLGKFSIKKGYIHDFLLRRAGMIPDLRHQYH
jgi:hypothetical protein